MAVKTFSSKSLFFLHKVLLRILGYPQPLPRKNKNNTHDSFFQFPKYPSLEIMRERDDLTNKTLVFDVEGMLLRSSDLFPYFMLVAFEAGGFLRGLILFLSYPFICLASKEWGLKIMVFISFFGLKKEKFLVGRTVLPKFFLEDVGDEGFDVIMSYGRKVGVTDMPSIMVEGFLKDYLGTEGVLGRKLKVCHGYFIGLMEVKATGNALLNEIFGEKKIDSHLISFYCTNKFLDQQLFPHFKEIYSIAEEDKRKWQVLPREKYPKPLTFHDGRLAFSPTLSATLTMFMWIPLGIFLSILRITIAFLLPYAISVPLLEFTGMRGIAMSSSTTDSSRISGMEKGSGHGTLYVCNHKTLLDPIYVSMALMKPLTAVTYSVSPISELLSPIKTSHLTRNKEKDSEMMQRLLSQGDLVVCPEGTTCREPYLLRFSPLFAELSDKIVPVAMDVHVSMFYGTTASGLKWLDPFFFLMNPCPTYNVRFLNKLPQSYSCWGGGKSSIDVANYVQKEIAKALGFQCTSLTRKDKYMILAGNEGTI